MRGAAPIAELDQLRVRYLAAQLRGDRREAVRLVDEGAALGATPLELADHVVRGAQREIGLLWETNKLGIAEEHMATAISHLVLAQLYERADQAPPNGKHVIVACVQGELHELPARLVADALDTAGFTVRYLGADVPVDGLVSMVRASAPDLLCLSSTMSFHGKALRETVTRIRALPGPYLPIAIGGAATVWSPGLVAELGADLTASNAADLILATKQKLGVAA